eukprot:m.480848 g.480848  ORF g.480848 m.480848 type:complete len:72 (-) comp21971_c0_seq1:84-299(-)
MATAVERVAQAGVKQEAAREQLIAVQTLNLLRDNLRTCYRKEGVNHIARCKDFADAYMAALKKHKDAPTGI